MNPVLLILIILGLIILWFLLSFMFFPLGRMVGRIVEDAKEAIDLDEKEKKE